MGSEIIQGLLPNDRQFDFYDIIANVVGSLAAVGLSSWYHNRMLERKRLAKHYTTVPGDEELDVELGEGVGAQEPGTTAVAPGPTLDEEVDNWDENAEDAWDEEEHGTGTSEGDGPKTPSASSAGDVEGETKKRAD